MKISAHLCQSRHGVFYFRQTSTVANKQRARKISLYTKDPITAKEKAIQLLALLASNKEENMIKKFEMTVGSNGVTFKTDKDDPDDIENLGRFLTKNPQFIPNQNQKIIEEVVKGESFNVIIEKYEDRQTGKVAKKTLYGYLQNIKIFRDWAERHFNKKDFSINLVDRKIIALYISHLRKLNINDNTIAKNYLICLNGIFDFAYSIGEYQYEQAPSRLHNLIDKKNKNEKPRNPYEIEELKVIFDPKNLPRDKHPEQFWAPLLALFTGGRISEICQLHRIDIGKREDFYTISINDEDDKILKNDASKRIIPIHPTLIEIGFLDFVDDMEKFGGQLFPTVRPDIFGYYGKEPGRRWATYCDKIGITDPTKVFHSFRTTTNVLMMDNGVEEEKRCAYIGHEHNTTNSGTYRHKGNSTRKKFTPEFLFKIVTPFINYELDFSGLIYKKGMFDKFIYNDLIKKQAAKDRDERLEKLGRKAIKK